jgi:hypothetical protein
MGYLPLFLVKALNLPAVLYCAWLAYSETLPEIGRSLYESDRSVHCYFTGLLINTPYYALLIYVGWWAMKKIRNRQQ